MEVSQPEVKMQSRRRHNSTPKTRFGGRRRLVPYVALACVAGVVGQIYVRWHTAQLESTLVRSYPQTILKSADLLRIARERGPRLYRDHCASCHGRQLEGNRARGAPNLGDKVWLYGTGSITDIETTILYGIRSGHPKAHNLTDMPGFGRSGRLTQQDIRDVVEYLLLLGGQPYDESSARRGQQIFSGAGVCYDCHGSDAYGVSDYGTPALTGRGGSWLYGGDRNALYKSVYDGRHGLCPAWTGRLSFVDIRALSVYLYESSHRD